VATDNNWFRTAVEIRPRPAERTVRHDFFGTHTESVLIEAPHRNFASIPGPRVSVSRRAMDRAAPSPAWESVRDVAFEATSLGPASPIGYVFASRWCRCSSRSPYMRR